MSNLILTKDVYLFKALSMMLNYVPADRTVCLIDIESFTSLGAIYRRLQRKRLTENHRLIFIGGKDVSSRVLEPLVTIYRKSSFINFRWQLTSGQTYSPEYALAHIAKCINLHMLTLRERKALYALRDTDDIRTAANMISLSPKTIYSYSRKIGEKLNLDSMLHVRQFISSELELDTADLFE
ncbi:hypothetical protein [Citrobacter amalonaticus]|nr:hypothetical protein [Citrobacter amalonaticus]